MGTWSVDTKSKPGYLLLKLDGGMSLDEIGAFVLEHNKAIDDLKGREYRVFADIRGLQPLSPEGAEKMQRAKEYSSVQKNFRGSAVWVSSAMVAMQQRRTSQEGGVGDSELMSDNEAELWKHLNKVNRVG